MFAKSLTLVSSVLVGAFSLLADTITWVGPTGDWSDPTLWDLQRVPTVGDDVVIDTAGAVVTLADSTPELKSLTLTGTGPSGKTAAKPATLSASGWQTCIQAETVTVNGYGVITCAAGGETEESLSRVYIKCEDLVVAADGKIDADGKGYNGTWSAKMAYGFGPGAGYCDNAWNGGGPKGASHGGYGGAQHGLRPLPYGDAETPITAGSSGGIGKWSSQLMPGGGVVTVEAENTVTVNGSVLASSPNTPKYGTGMGNDATAGAGGSICIVSAVFKGVNGIIRADGGSTSCPTNLNTGRAGGGGRIALTYAPLLQQREFVSGMTISAAAGLYKWKTGTTVLSLGVTDSDTFHSEAGLGSLWFTDDKLLGSLGTGISGAIFNPAEVTLPSLTLQSGHVSFAKEGAKVSIDGDLTISGTSARLEIGGFEATNVCDFISLRAGMTPVELTVGGRLRVENGGRLDVRSATTNALYGTVGALVKVAGAMEVVTGGHVMPWSDFMVGGSPRFEVGSLYVDADSEISADSRGFGGGYALDKQTGSMLHGDAYGPGAGLYYSSVMGVGGGHGGIGGGRETRYYGGGTYDDPYVPAQAGSGGAVTSGWMFNGGIGGGVVDVRAVGPVVIEGRVSANGETGNGCSAKTAGAGSGSGGAVFLYGRTVTSTEGSSITACGADADLPANEYYGAGGGGRISIWAGATMTTDGVKEKRITRSSDPADMPEGLSIRGTVSVAAGVCATTYQPADGTVWYTHIADRPGLLMLVR